MPSSDPISLGALGAVLALGGLVTLMLGEGPNPNALAAATACLVGAVLAFAVEALLRRRLRWLREAEAAKAAREAGRAPSQPAPAAGAEAIPVAARGQPHRAVLASVRVRRDGRGG